MQENVHLFMGLTNYTAMKRKVEKSRAVGARSWNITKYIQEEPMAYQMR